jgi:hypothetical protein
MIRAAIFFALNLLLGCATSATAQPGKKAAPLRLALVCASC